MYFLIKMVMFRFHVRLQRCKWGESQTQCWPKRAVNLQSLGSEHGHCSPRDVWDVGAVSVHVCSDGRPTCTQRIPEVPSRYQAFKRCFFLAVLTQGRRSRLGSFRSVLCLFFLLWLFLSFWIPDVQNCVGKHDQMLCIIIGVLAHRPCRCLPVCMLFVRFQNSICWIQIVADICPIW